MRFWHERHLGYEQFLDPDQLHMNDWSYGCLANALATAMIRTLGSSQRSYCLAIRRSHP